MSKNNKIKIEHKRLPKPAKNMSEYIENNGYSITYHSRDNNKSKGRAKLDYNNKNAKIYLKENLYNAFLMQLSINRHKNTKIAKDIIPHELAHIIIEIDVNYNLTEFLFEKVVENRIDYKIADLLLHPTVLSIMLQYQVNQEELIEYYENWINDEFPNNGKIKFSSSYEYAVWINRIVSTYKLDEISEENYSKIKNKLVEPTTKIISILKEISTNFDKDTTLNCYNEIHNLIKNKIAMVIM